MKPERLETARCLPFIVMIMALASCGSGDTEIVSDAPFETAAEQRARSVDIAARSDTLVASTVYGDIETNLPPGILPESIVAPSVCSVSVEAQCIASEPTTGASLTLSLGSFVRNLEPDLDSHEAVLTRNGITLTEGLGGRYGPTYRQYGAWMNHAGFYVLTGAREEAEIFGDIISVTLRGTAAGGDLSGTRPSESATWNGLMTGTTATEGGILTGDAMLTYDMASHTLDASFTNITDVDRDAAHTVNEVSFLDVPVAADGSFDDGSTGNLVRGGFTGPTHDEGFGVFEQKGVVGAFGAIRQ